MSAGERDIHCKSYGGAKFWKEVEEDEMEPRSALPVRDRINLLDQLGDGDELAGSEGRLEYGA